MVPQGGAGRAAGGSGSRVRRRTPRTDRAPRTSHKLVGPWDSPGPPIGATHPQPAMAAGVAFTPGGSFAVRTPTALSNTRAPGPFGPGGSQRRSGKFGPGHRKGRPGGAANEPWKERSFQGWFAAPPGRRDPAAPRPQDGTGSMRSAGGCVRPATPAGSRTRRTRAGAGGRGRGQPGGWRRSTRPRGAPGDRPGAANEP